MGMGDDIGSVFKEVGVGYTILRSPFSGIDITGEYLDYDSNKQVTKPFVIEHQMSVEVAYNSQVVPGDLLLFTNDLRKYYVMHLSEEVFENEIVSKSAVLYKANDTVTISRGTKTGPGYNPGSTSFLPIYSSIPVVLDNKDYGARTDQTPEPVDGTKRWTFAAYLPKSLDVKLNDRLTINGYSSGLGPAGVLNIMVQQRDDFVYRGMTVLYLSEDPRK